MAEYQIGQIRYTGSGCVDPVSTNPPTYQNISMSGGTSEGSSYKDVLISPQQAFIKDHDYYFSISIPQDMNYDMEFDLKLIKSEDNVNTVYQYLKKISIGRGGTGENVYTVVLYEKSDGDVAAMLPLTYQYGSRNTKDAIYYNSSNGQYFLGNGDTTYTRTYNFNDIAMVASWREETGINRGTFELIFRPVEDNFTGILLQMTRTPEDMNIQHADGSFGRQVDLDNIIFTLYELTNQVNNINRDGVLSRIGIWSHPGLLMAINGEEIRVGPSGYYELSSDLIDIESIGIVAKDSAWEDNWTMDYEYPINQEGD